MNNKICFIIPWLYNELNAYIPKRIRYLKQQI